MRVWDIHPAYLARQSLLGEHREIHGLWTVVTEGRSGYGQHPFLGPAVARMATPDEFSSLALRLVVVLREAVVPGDLTNALLHLWGYMKGRVTTVENSEIGALAKERPAVVLAAIAEAAPQIPYLWTSTVLSELVVRG